MVPPPVTAVETVYALVDAKFAVIVCFSVVLLVLQKYSDDGGGEPCVVLSKYTLVIL
jgi:hypothetical protein